MATTADFKNGLCIDFNGKPCSIVWFQHVKPGKGPAFVKTKLRNLENGRILEKTYNAGEKIETITVEHRPYLHNGFFTFLLQPGFYLVDYYLDEKLVNSQELIIEDREHSTHDTFLIRN